ncbi:MAG: HAMP domain-containing sensor histidine kinase [Cyanobacteriota/Melainabacteria group bacterium]
MAKSKSGLFQKGLLLLMIPFLLQIVFSFWFALIYLDAARALHYQATRIYASTVCSKVGALSMNMMGDIFLAMHVTISDTSKSVMIGVTIISIDKEKEFKAALAELAEVGREFKEISSRIRPLVEGLKSFEDATTEECLSSNSISNEKITTYLRTGLIPLRRQLHDTIESLNDLASSPSLEYFTRSGNVELLILGLITASILTNIFVAINLWLVTRKTVLANIETIDENFKRLAENKELLPPLSREDEFSQFDRDFREIADQVLTIRLERQRYLEVMSRIMREPLTDLNRFLERMGEGTYLELTPKSEAMLSRTTVATRRLVLMLNELIDFEQIEQGTFSLTLCESSAAAIIQTAIDCVQAPPGKNILMEARAEESLFIKADPDRLTQVLINLLSNALKFAPSDSTITLSARQEAQMVVFSVQDQGRGIPEEMLTRIFERYEQVDQIGDSKEKKGSGLGLAICKSIVEAHGGEIWAANAESGGAIMSFSIPEESQL